MGKKAKANARRCEGPPMWLDPDWRYPEDDWDGTVAPHFDEMPFADEDEFEMKQAYSPEPYVPKHPQMLGPLAPEEIGGIHVKTRTFYVTGLEGEAQIKARPIFVYDHYGDVRFAGYKQRGEHPVQMWLRLIMSGAYTPFAPFMRECPRFVNGVLQPFDDRKDPAREGVKLLEVLIEHTNRKGRYTWKYMGVGMAYDGERPFDVFMRQIRGGRIPDWCPFAPWKADELERQELIKLVCPGGWGGGTLWYPVLDVEHRFNYHYDYQ